MPLYDARDGGDFRGIPLLRQLVEPKLVSHESGAIAVVAAAKAALPTIMADPFAPIGSPHKSGTKHSIIGTGKGTLRERP
jgi:hypothetical protein